MTAMSKLRATRIVRMCFNWSDYDSGVVSCPCKDEDGRLHWQVFYASAYYHVTYLSGEWFVSRVEARVASSLVFPPDRTDVTLL